MRTTLDPKLDIVFKMLLSDPRNVHILIAFLTDVLQPTTPIIGVTVLDPNTERASVEDKGAIFDLYVRTSGGQRTLTEIQLRSGGNFTGRSLFYWARAYASQLVPGQDYPALEPVTGIFILDYAELRGDRFHRTFQLLDTQEHTRLNRDIELHFIELPKLRRAQADAERDPVLRWARFLAARADEELEALAMEDPMLNEAKLALERLSKDTLAREAAIKREIELSSFRGELRVEHEKGRVEGRVEGLTEGARATLKRQLALKFGEAAPTVLARVDTATLEDLTSWTERILTADSLEELFA